MREWLRDRPALVTVAAVGVAVATAAAIAGAYGFASFGDAWAHLHFGWLAVALAAELLAMGAYVLAYRVVVRYDRGPSLDIPLLVRVVLAGFGPFKPGGGFALDHDAKKALAEGEPEPAVRVLGLGALEWALLAPAAWAAALILLVTGDRRAMPSVLWPWVIAVPIGFGVGLWLAMPRRRERLGAGEGRGRRLLKRALRGVGVLHGLARNLDAHWAAWVGMGLYWAFDIAAFYGASRFVGLHITVGEAVVAFATGYAITRRSMPLGGAGATEALLTFSLHWMGQPVLPALAAVVVYRAVNFVCPAVPALIVKRRLNPVLASAARGRAASEDERRHASAPLGQPRT